MKLKKSIVTALIITNVLFGGHLAFASDTSQSDVELEYTKKVGPTNPIHPTKPGEVELDPENPVTGNEGELTIDYISAIKFGKHQIANKDMVYQAELSSVVKDGQREDTPNHIQITDDRGSLAGWILKVKQDEALRFGQADLKNTILTFKNGVSKSDNTSSLIYTPKVNETNLTADGESQTIIEAKKNQGMGTWVSRFGVDNEEGKKSIELMVPWNVAKVEGSYHTSLIWELGNTPG
ncbi:WxL domain-containing protein [Carnobacterium divergens]|uniref:WxL domain-containing protein n=1 Tax=Carnobacterium divergens TaxID=2748 RepID=A0A7Z8D0H7_CARDV|nr:WxL domain-containing protein [Carnobacterium divergens]MPQ22971.1 WxL domain-containing protein [Carnobacterium divergens]TFI74464.1 hypothetical protein CKN58_04360 [Carnobacterium divergens]TFI78786.1 hypothetical protein CKN85_04355 [Carnobacterium divergens]TFI85345.1 hypothetical protein CKN56_04330 [Carnobacterium divergens]TFI97701.1 hypothetical protein CKN64_04330 [Carnobacterium divergens]